ncbi:hypothetical protein [Neobacillus vireti]|uniref:hypothetical protein n=1 Tax=Neobacillus vireti TaxID=220686 RepID=UPI002FFE6615
MGRLANKVSIITGAASTNGLYQDGPGVDEYSRHCQVFAILIDTIDKERRLVF